MLAMEKDEALNPIDVGLFGANAVMFDPNGIAHLVEQFRFVFSQPADYRPGHDADSAAFNPKLKPDYAQFLGLIRLEFRVEGGRIGVMTGTIVSRLAKNKPKLLDQVARCHSGQTLQHS